MGKTERLYRELEELKIELKECKEEKARLRKSNRQLKSRLED